MGSILREILMGEVRVLAGGDPEKIAEECADKIMEALGLKAGADEESASGSCAGEADRKDEDTLTEQRDGATDGKAAAGIKHESTLISAGDAGTFRVSMEHIAGAPAASVSVDGRWSDVFNGIANLLRYTALALTDGKTAEAAMVAGKIGEMVKEGILLGGAESAED